MIIKIFFRYLHLAREERESTRETKGFCAPNKQRTLILPNTMCSLTARNSWRGPIWTSARTSAVSRLWVLTPIFMGPRFSNRLGHDDPLRWSNQFLDVSEPPSGETRRIRADPKADFFSSSRGLLCSTMHFSNNDHTYEKRISLLCIELGHEIVNKAQLKSRSRFQTLRQVTGWCRKNSWNNCLIVFGSCEPIIKKQFRIVSIFRSDVHQHIEMIFEYIFPGRILYTFLSYNQIFRRIPNPY